MKSLFQIRFLLKAIGLLLLVLCLKLVGSQSRDSIGGPVEVAYREGYYAHFLLLGLRFIVAGIVVPGGIGLLVYGFLRWRHSSEQAPPIGLSLLLPLLVSCAWGLLGVLIATSLRGVDMIYYTLPHFLIQVGLTIAAARFGYHEGRTLKQPLKESTG